MSTAGHIVFGINLKDEVFEHFQEDLDKLLDLEITNTEYDGNGNSPHYIGLEIHTLGEYQDEYFSSIRLEPTEEEVEQFNTQLKQVLDCSEISLEFKELLQSLDDELFITWSNG